MGPHLVPVSSDRGAGGNGGSQLSTTRCTVVIASNARIGSVGNRVAAFKSVNDASELGRRGLLGRPGALNGSLASWRVVGRPRELA